MSENKISTCVFDEAIDKVAFISILKKYGFIEDAEYKGVLAHPKENGILTWFDEEKKMMAISFDMEYTIYKKATLARLVAISELFE